FFFVYLFYYYWTSAGGPTFLAMTLVPVTFVLFVLTALRDDDLYPGLPLAANYAIAAIYIGCALLVAYYMNTEYYDLGTVRAANGSATDRALGALMTVRVLKFSRKRRRPLFVINLVLIVYAVYGYVAPGIFSPAGLSWQRVITAMSVETTTGVF